MLITLAIILILFTMMYGFGSKRNQMNQKKRCQGNLQKAYISLQIYANEHENQFPAVTNAVTSEEALDVLVPKYCADTGIFICPAFFNVFRVFRGSSSPSFPMTQSPSTPRGSLFTMMALEFFIWGAWLPLIFGYLPSLGFTPTQQSLILNAFPVASIVGMFFSNQWADRKFNPEKFLAFSHLVGGLAILGCGFTKDFTAFFLLMLVHCLLYVPTISITNSIAFANMRDPEKEFGLVRMGGTIGWILAAWPFTFIFVNWDAVAAANDRDALSTYRGGA